jgi:acyl carrier protein
MTTESWTPRNEEQVEKRLIEMINDYLKLELKYPLPQDMSIKDLKILNDEELAKELESLPEAIAEARRKNNEVDSIDILELVIQIEEEFGCVIDDKEIATLLKWKDLVGYITDSQDPTKMLKK